jgi:hypothetical protein
LKEVASQSVSIRGLALLLLAPEREEEVIMNKNRIGDAKR